MNSFRVLAGLEPHKPRPKNSKKTKKANDTAVTVKA